MPPYSDSDKIAISGILSATILGVAAIGAVIYQIRDGRSTKNEENKSNFTQRLKDSLSELQRCLNSYGVDSKEARLQLEHINEEMIQLSKLTKIPMNSDFQGALRNAVSNDKYSLHKCQQLLRKEKKRIIDYYSK